jgi:hypothetical protein
MTNETEYLKVLNQGMGLFGMGFDLAALNNSMNQFYSGLTTLEQKSDFIDYIEFKYIPGYRVNMQQFSEMRDYTSKANEKLKLIEGWVIRNKAVRQTSAHTAGDKLTLKQIALIHAFEEWDISRENCNEIAQQYEHTSGKKLAQEFTDLQTSSKRTREFSGWTPRKQRNRIELFESVIEHLSEKAITLADKEIQTLKRIAGFD